MALRDYFDKFENLSGIFPSDRRGYYYLKRAGSIRAVSLDRVYHLLTLDEENFYIDKKVIDDLVEKGFELDLFKLEGRII